ncbi:GNAT family N-acetyltransferase [Plantactinospora sp. B5E13]|uniref:GNAT family N-acetyltransferase n=1 Tax=unclassified Plantactinospora TaxID=2631981 RepID=UPI00325EC74C
MSAENLAALAESAEAECNYRMVALAPERTRQALGISTTRIGGAFTWVTRNDPMAGYWNKTLGLGVTEPVTRDVLDKVIEFHRDQGSPSARIQIAPDLLPPDWDEIRAAYGLTPGAFTVQLGCAVGDIAPARTDLRIGPVGAADFAQWVSLLYTVFQMPEHFDTLFRATLGQPDFRAFAAWDGDQMVAAANLFLNGEVGGLNSAVTRESHRGRGAQSALTAARARAAAEAGCRRLVVQTGRPAAGERHQSLENLLRVGFTRLYDRQDWVWQPAPGGTDA